MQALAYDLRDSFRMLAKNPGLTAVIILSLAVGIGANAAVFGVASALLITPLPYPESNRLVNVWLRSPGLEIPQDWPSPGQYHDIQTGNHVFEDTAIALGRSFVLTTPTQGERIEGLRTSSSLLQMLGAKAMLGRMLTAEEDIPGKPQVAVLTSSAWQRLFGNDPQIVGKSIIVDGAQVTVVGVLTAEFMLTSEVMPVIGNISRMEIFLPLPLGSDVATRRGTDNESFNVVARLKPGITVRQAQADIDVIAARIREFEKRDPSFRIGMVPLLEQEVGNVRRSVLVTMGSVALVLLIACANVATLLVSRAAIREKEVTIRVALGAGRLRLVRQVLIESILLGLLGGAAGLVIARWSLYIVRTTNPGNIPRLDLIGIDRSVIAFGFGISILTGIIFGAVPAFRVAKVDLNSVLRSGGRDSHSGGFHSRRHRLLSFLVIGEISLSLMLLVGAGLLIRSFVRLQSVSPGFNPDNVISMRVQIVPRAKPSGPEAAQRFFREIRERISHLPGVKSQAGVSTLPFTSAIGWGEIDVQGYIPPSGRPELQADLRFATPGYFETMGIPLVKGRYFSEHDALDGQPGALPVALVDEKMASRFWPHEDPIGKQVRMGPKQPWRTVVGVVGMVKQYGLATQGKMVAYFPTDFVSYLVARTSSDPARTADTIIREIHVIDPDAVVYDVQTMQKRMYDSLARQRFSSWILSTFAAFAMFLACVGVYGVISYQVTQCSRDIGVRVALGAQRSNIFRLVVRQGLELAAMGIAAGLFAALSLSRVMASLLYGISAFDGITFSGVALLLMAIVLLATYVPARRATEIDPMEALRLD